MSSKLVYIIRKDEIFSSKHSEISELTSYHHDVIELTLEQAFKADLSSALMIIMDIAPDNFETVLELRKLLEADNIQNISIFFI
ncbi:MAG: hypothetical protein P8J14_09105, partial [Emcibacteraceae bacterium]|nr:hypothetical protein [Emcibacteraceae bacterium]